MTLEILLKVSQVVVLPLFVYVVYLERSVATIATDVKWIIKSINGKGGNEDG